MDPPTVLARCLDLTQTSAHISYMENIRPPAVAGSFYPDQEQALRTTVEDFLEAADNFSLSPKALVVPHAGFIYSGPIAAQAYKSLSQVSPLPKKVILLGPCHQVPVRCLALPQSKSFATPLGLVPIDEAACHTLSQLPFVEVNQQAHAYEHSLEVQLPFLQMTLAEFSLIPLVVGRASADQICQALEAVIDKQSLIVVSTDLSHYLSYDSAKKIDQETVTAVLENNSEIVVGDRACGAYPLKGLMKFANKVGWKPELLDLRNSGDTAGDKTRVVGYGAFIYHD